ncbi:MULTISPECIES: ATP-binding cassette domain-containing protein [unclassified Pannonibacter]|uniref:ATP-binding cassette domain-containing protein n=1 Tax=unclassified Pannonibacter TaxID=2627228 RepID=UPI0016468C19|nr:MULTISPECIES: ATP-binding cassette domain-containing protein [unclassified Pannonibacter]
MPDTAQRLARLAAQADHTGEEDLRRAALDEGLLLRRVRLMPSSDGRQQWPLLDGGLIIVFAQDSGRAQVIDTRNGRPVLVQADGRRGHAPVPGDVMPQALALVAPLGRAVPLWQEACAALLAGLAFNAPAAALILAPSPLSAGAGLALMASGGALAAALRQTADLRRLGLADLASASAIWQRLARATPAQLNQPSAASVADQLANKVIEARKASLRKGGRLSGLGLALPALGLLCATGLAPLAAAAAVILPGLALRLWLMRQELHLEAAMKHPSAELQQTSSLAAAALPQLRLMGEAGWLLQKTGRIETEVRSLQRRHLRLGACRSALAVLLTGAAGLAAWLAAGPEGSLAIAGGVIAAATLAAAAVQASRPLLPHNPQGLNWLEDSTASAALPGAIAPIEEIRCEDLSFRYHEAPEKVLENVSLTVRRGAVTALTGPSGCGKSTLIQLLLGFQSPKRGRILVDGQPLGQLDLASYRRRIGCVFQDESISLDTIRAAILGMAPLRDEAIARALRVTGLEEEIATLPMGVQTLVAEGVVPQSLVQRLLIARAVARGPDFLILDETVTGLDQDQISRLLEALRENGTGVLIVTHNPAILAQADTTLRLGKGGG